MIKNIVIHIQLTYKLLLKYKFESTFRPWTMLLYTRRHKTKMSNAVGSENCLFVQENVQNSLYLTQYSNEKKTTTKLSIQLITIAMKRRKKNPQRGGGRTSIFSAG